MMVGDRSAVLGRVTKELLPKRTAIPWRPPQSHGVCEKSVPSRMSARRWERTRHLRETQGASFGEAEGPCGK